MFGLEKLFPVEMGADMAATIVINMLKKLKADKGAESIVLYLDDKDEVIITEYKFRVPDKFMQAKQRIEDLENMVNELEDEKERMGEKIHELEIEVNGLINDSDFSEDAQAETAPKKQAFIHPNEFPPADSPELPLTDKNEK